MPKDKPFPWTCGHCLHKAVEPRQWDFEEEHHWHGRVYVVRIDQLVIPTCSHCGEKCFSMRVSNQIYEKLRELTGETLEEFHRMDRQLLEENDV